MVATSTQLLLVAEMWKAKNRTDIKWKKKRKLDNYFSLSATSKGKEADKNEQEQIYLEGKN